MRRRPVALCLHAYPMPKTPSAHRDIAPTGRAASQSGGFVRRVRPALAWSVCAWRSVPLDNEVVCADNEPFGSACSCGENFLASASHRQVHGVSTENENRSSDVVARHSCLSGSQGGQAHRLRLEAEQLTMLASELEQHHYFVVLLSRLLLRTVVRDGSELPPPGRSSSRTCRQRPES